MTETDERLTVGHRRQSTVVRELGLFERLHCVASQDRSVHFLIVAEFGIRLDAGDVESALAALVERHPLLSVTVSIRPDGSGVFERSSGLRRAQVRVVDDSGATWQREAYRELDLPFDGELGPLVRLTLVHRDADSAVLLCLDHTIADGVSGVCLLNDLVAVLNGHTLEPLELRSSAEELMANQYGDPEPHERATHEDPRMTAPTRSLRARGGTASLTAFAMTAADTSALARRCRAERTTVHAAMVVAASGVRAGDTGHDFIRTANPISLRSLIGVGADCGMFISQAITGLAPTDDTRFWHQCRDMTARLTIARSPAAIQAVTAAMHAAAPTGVTAAGPTGVTAGGPIGVTAAEATDRLLDAFPHEICVTNLGVKDVTDTGTLRPTAVWGPITQNVSDDCTIGIVTYGGRLRMTAFGLNLGSALLERVAEKLVIATRLR